MSLQNKKVLITGGNGFLGTGITCEMKNKAKVVYSYPGDVREIEDLSEKFDLVLHLAAIVKSSSDKDASVLNDVNVNGTLSVMKYCKKVGAKCVFASSAAVYKPISGAELIKEEKTSLEPVSEYGKSKKLAEDICGDYSEKYGVNIIILRIFNVYGPGQREPYLIPYLINTISKNQPPVLKTPDAVRDFVYIKDVVDAFMSASDSVSKKLCALNIGIGVGISVKELALKISAMLGKKMDHTDAGNNAMKPYRAVADIGLAKEVLDWSPSTSLDSGLEMLTSSMA